MRALPLVVLLLMVVAGLAQAHGERRVEFPAGDREVPVFRDSGPYELVCKEDTPARLGNLSFEERVQETLRWTECMETGHRHLQAAVDAVPRGGHRILMMPGHYFEEPSVAALRDPSPECAPFVTMSIIEYEDNWNCPNIHNTVAILGDDPDDEDIACTWERLCDLQIQGTGKHREDVIIDAAWNHLNAVRADRADGFYITGVTIQRTDFNSLYILQTDGFVIDDVLTRWNYEYGFLTFAVDHGLYIDCESYGNGDSGIYPGSASDLKGERPSIEITRCDSHHNALGYSGTAGNSVYVHNNKFHHNAAGIATDSLFPDHPGLPQDHGVFVNNDIFSNNENYFDNWLPGGPCHKPLAERGIEEGVVCPVIPIPVGTGILIAGGNDNLVQENWIYDNWRYGTMLFGVPSYFRGEDDPTDPATLETQFDTSHRNRYLANQMGIAPDGTTHPNGIDHWWDEQGSGNCWKDNVYAGGAMRTDATDPILYMPTCGVHDAVNNQFRPMHPRLVSIVPCNDFSKPDNTHPDGCAWMSDPEEP